MVPNTEIFKKLKLVDCESVHQYYTLPIPITIFLWRYYVASGSELIIYCHRSDKTYVFKRKCGMEVVKKNA